jgi:hypothetical protein
MDYREKIAVLESKIANQDKLCSIENRMDRGFSSISKFFQSTNAELGESGELFVYNLIKDLIRISDNSLLDRVNGVSNSCDLYLQHDSVKCGIEVKNHVHPIKADNIKRFMEVDMANPSYNCGLFISLKSGFVHSSKVSHFKVFHAHGKPVLFIENGVDNKQTISIAIKMLNYLVANKAYGDTDRNNMIERVSRMLKDIETIVKNNSSAMKAISDSKIVTDRMIEDINFILKVPSKKIEKKLMHVCGFCSFSTPKKVEYNRHIKQNH